MKQVYSLFTVLLTLCLSLASVTASAQANKGLSETDALTFLHDSGLDELINSIAPTMEQQFNLQRLTETNGLASDKVQAAMMEAVQSIQGYDLAINYLTSEADTKRLKTAMEFLASPLGRRIAAEERAASSPDAQLEIQAYAMQMAKNPPPESRIKLIQDLAGVLNADEVIMSMIRGIIFSLVDVTDAVSPSQSAGLKATLDAEWEKMEPMMREQFRQFMVMGSHYSYRNLADDDLQAYIEFLKTDSGQAYWMAGIEIVNIYMQAFSREMATVIQRQRS